MKVLKFGGTSVANAENIKQVKQIVAKTEADLVMVVVSAMGGITDLLLQTASLAAKKDEAYKELLKTIEDRHISAIQELIPIQAQSAILSKVKSDLNELESLIEGAFLIGEITSQLSDKIVGYGELLSSYLLSEYFKTEGLNATFKDSRELIRTDDTYGKAAVDFALTNENCHAFLKTNQNNIVVLPGFVAASKEGATTTLGRGGSDYSAAIFAAAMGAEELQIWTDVSGMYTANPNLVKQAKAIAQISYEEAMELSHFGAKVLYPPTIQPILAQEIPISIKNTFAPEAAGTQIIKSNQDQGKNVRGISNISNIALISIEGPGMIGVPGISSRFFGVLSQTEISVVLITQASSEHSICVGITADEVSKALKALNLEFEYEINSGKINPIEAERDLAVIALVGDQMKSHQGLSGKMFSSLGRNNVNVRAIAQGASERNISAVINEADVKKALNTLHETFFEDQVKQLNLFVIGVGNVGAKFLNQLQRQKTFLKDELALHARIIGISNSRTMVIKENGIALDQWEAALKGGDKADIQTFFEKMFQLNLRNSILVDNTASEAIAQSYQDCLRRNVAVVTCNKIACSSTLDTYKELKHLSRRYNAPFLFETNVGAGLPILDTLKNLIASGDRIQKIEAVLSGSLNFIFNHFNAETSFYEVVVRAQQEGYTEPDPKVDLSGIDVMRKILILARESGYDINLSDIANHSFLPEDCRQSTDLEGFLESLKDHEGYFQEIYQKATEKDCRLKYVAQFEEGQAQVGLQEIPAGHDFYTLEGSDNVVLFYTDRYKEQPLIIKGAGAGAEVTASGLFADIIRIGNF